MRGGIPASYSYTLHHPLKTLRSVLYGEATPTTNTRRERVNEQHSYPARAMWAQEPESHAPEMDGCGGEVRGSAHHLDD